MNRAVKPGGKIFAIGDIHGYLNKLEALMRKIHPDPDRDELVFLGDYVDRAQLQGSGGDGSGDQEEFPPHNMLDGKP